MILILLLFLAATNEPVLTPSVATVLDTNDYDCPSNCINGPCWGTNCFPPAPLTNLLWVSGSNIVTGQTPDYSIITSSPVLSPRYGWQVEGYVTNATSFIVTNRNHQQWFFGVEDVYTTL